LRQSVVWFKRAIGKAPSNALAWAALANAYIIIGIHCVDDPSDSFQRARAAAEEAARIVPSLPEALIPLAMFELCFLRQLTGPEEKFRRALEAKPTLPFAHNGLGLLRAATGQAEAFVISLRHAIAVSPLSPPLNAFLCYSLCFTRRFEDAVTAGRKAVLGDPESFLAHLCLGNALLYQGRYDEGLFYLEKACSFSHDSKNNLGFWAYGCALAGQGEKAERVLTKWASLPQHEYVPSYFVGLIHVGFGHTEAAIDWLNRACEERSHWVIFLESDPAFDSLRQVPRFEELVNKCRLRD
jgi:tetratricopeptide (TPR) repeat protein